MRQLCDALELADAASGGTNQIAPSHYVGARGLKAKKEAKRELGQLAQAGLVIRLGNGRFAVLPDMKSVLKEIRMRAIRNGGNGNDG